ncbi:hypothetical protein FGADI_9963 [Fusarium gaditjirri]|uniref:Uncharacterized protein n=1 Tax=Fusarium gaditjirri TaxID=282569 RepID=A0A8H4SY69_9HYPO|nr:hypothetical protein FGADI_9963 [Fusarium gaditjirri]
MGVLAKIKFRLRKVRAKYKALRASLERVCKNMTIRQAPRAVERGRHWSFTMNAPQRNPFAATGALLMPFPEQTHQQPFTGQQFGPRVATPNSLERVCKVCSSCRRTWSVFFFTMNAPQGNPFAAAEALEVPFTGQQFGHPVATPNSSPPVPH